MSDVTVAPAGGAPAAAPSNEVVINPGPNIPNPIGNQTPDKPVGDVDGGKGRPESRREAIQKAFDRANNPTAKTAKPAEKPAAKPAEAKPGHNQPPEETPPLDLKKRPGDQPHREQGRFARAPDAPAQPGAQPQQHKRLLPEGAPYREPPQRMAEHAKRDWDTAPESVRGEVHRMHAEFNEAYKRHKADADAFSPVRQFHQMAQQQGTTLERALNNYVSMEMKLRSDPIGGLDVIVNNLGLTDPQTGKRIDLRDVAYSVLSQSPEQLKMLQQGNAQNAAAQQIGALHQEISALKGHLHQMHTRQQFAATRSAVDVFAETHPRLDELGDLIEGELRLGFPLEVAYRRAEMLRPTHAAQTRAPPAQTRTADKSISGAPGVTGSDPAPRRSEKPVGRRDAIQDAIRRVGGGV